MRAHHQNGFTLLEMMLAIMLLAIISALGYQQLQSMLRNSELTQQHTSQLAEIQRAFQFLEQDISQAFVLTPPVKASPQPPAFSTRLTDDENFHLTLTQSNWYNPGAYLERSTLERVDWSVTPQGLVRQGQALSYGQQYLQPQRVMQFPHISAFTLRFWHKGRWFNEWNAEFTLPQAIEVTLQTKTYGVLQRVIEVSPTDAK
jgi:general secretion pathway protein J